jgi:hypothetical protein
MQRVRNLVLINSKIIVSGKPLSYSNTRSIYSTEERFRQTKETIRTVKEHIPRQYIVFVDNSVLPTEVREYLASEVDLMINPTDDVSLNEDTDANPTKAVGELAQITRAIEYIDELDFEWTNLFKICGRYTLNSSFDYSKFENAHNVFRIDEPLTAYKSRANHPLTTFKSRVGRLLGPRRLRTTQSATPHEASTCYFTSFYKISRQNYQQYKEALAASLSVFKRDPRYANEPLELVLCNRIEDKVVLGTIGATIDCAVETWIEDI